MSFTMRESDLERPRRARDVGTARGGALQLSPLTGVVATLLRALGVVIDVALLAIAVRAGGFSHAGAPR